MTTGIDSAIHGGYTQHVNSPGTVADRWWTMVVRGLAAVIFGVFALIAPRTTALAIVYIFGVYAIIDGLVHWMSAGRAAQSTLANDESRGWLIFQGLVSVAAGVFALAYPRLTGEMLVVLIAAWAVLTGISEVAAAVALRRRIRNEWLLATGGVLSIVLGVVLFVSPNMGVVALLWTVGAYAIVFGVMMVALGFRLRAHSRHGRHDRHGSSRGGTATSTGAVPA